MFTWSLLKITSHFRSSHGEVWRRFCALFWCEVFLWSAMLALMFVAEVCGVVMVCGASVVCDGGMMRGVVTVCGGAVACDGVM